MKKTSVASLRSHLSAFLDRVEKGEEVEIQKRNVSIAKIVPIKRVDQNKTSLGCGKGSVKFLGDVTEPVMTDDWEMLQ